MPDKTVTLFWGVGLDANITAALNTALNHVDAAAAAQGRLVTQVSHTVTILRGDQPAVKAAATAIGVHSRPQKNQEYAVVTVTATTISTP
ncbi:hypothetical protein [Allobranchiibius huperziae]|uniref:Uncharacterized protein n=1 Tax=Allobranchiibius huperziae TaxID=1874116 RepID=A0A853DNC6_9MICO|nr:hypothetical protein [Allobranchiibius huperziae]NYJ76494.1 hypothetical protein [Allobranchiibius huperziae]